MSRVRASALVLLALVRTAGADTVPPYTLAAAEEKSARARFVVEVAVRPPAEVAEAIGRDLVGRRTGRRYGAAEVRLYGTGSPRSGPPDAFVVWEARHGYTIYTGQRAAEASRRVSIGMRPGSVLESAPAVDD